MSSFDTAVGVFLICLWMCSIVVSLTNSLAVNTVSQCSIRVDVPLAVLTSIYNIQFVGTLLKWGAPQEAEAALVPGQMLLNRPVLITGLPLPILQHVHRFLIPLSAMSMIPLIFVYRNSCSEDVSLSKGVQAFYWGAYCSLFGLAPFGIYLWYRLYTQQTRETLRDQAGHILAITEAKTLLDKLSGKMAGSGSAIFKQFHLDLVRVLELDIDVGRRLVAAYLIECFQQRFLSNIPSTSLQMDATSSESSNLSCGECKAMINVGEMILNLQVSSSEHTFFHKYCFLTSHAYQKQPSWMRTSSIKYIAEQC